MSGRSLYDLDLNDTMIEGATIALLPGDPGRVVAIACTAPIAPCRGRGDHAPGRRFCEAAVGYRVPLEGVGTPTSPATRKSSRTPTGVAPSAMRPLFSSSSSVSTT